MACDDPDALQSVSSLPSSLAAGSINHTAGPELMDRRGASDATHLLSSGSVLAPQAATNGKSAVDTPESIPAPITHADPGGQPKGNLGTIMPPGDSSALQTPGDGADRFRIIKEHARGGLGVVFVAEDRELRREVALKQIRADRSDHEVYRFKFIQEAEVTGQLEHPGIVPIYALGSDQHGRPYYAMRFINGVLPQLSVR